jgi:ABC-type Fe3+-hydroxamate transport system substrate-binding protein
MIRRFAASIISLLLATPLAFAEPVAPEHATKVATIDWGIAETLTALGAPPLGVGESAGYRDWVASPILPEGVADLGLRSTPNLEYLSALDPDVILSTPQFAAVQPVLERIAPVLSLATYTADLKPYANAVENTRRLGSLLDREEAAKRLIAETEARIERLATAFGGSGRKRVLVIYFQDDRHLWVFAKGSLFDDVLKRAGIENAWTGGGNFWGFANASVDQLFDLGDAAALIIEPVPLAVRTKLGERDGASLLNQLPIFKQGNFVVLPCVWGFGGLPSAGRFADLLLQHVNFLTGDHAS